MEADQFAHVIRQFAGQQAVGRDRQPIYAHIASYNPANHTVRVICPSLRDENGNCIVSGWLQLGTLSVGNNFGIQIAPLGGATAQNPTLGEQVILDVIDPFRGRAVIRGLSFNNDAPPPGLAMGILAGEIIIKAKSGSYIRFHANGDIEINATGTVSVTATTAATIVAPVIKLASNLMHTLHALCTELFEGWASTHLHSNGNGGANTGPPTTPPPPGSLTTVVQAE